MVEQAVVFTNSSDELLQPELLSTETIIKILQDRGLKVTPSNDRHQLLELYNRLALPKSKRIYNEQTREQRKLVRLRSKYCRETSNNNKAMDTVENLSAGKSALSSINLNKQLQKRVLSSNHSSGIETLTHVTEKSSSEPAPKKKALITWP